ncbi:PREDICTED: venom serine protease 34-like, partial [Wasmannia auropunctata]|uniref:venom serine protease 34-like n=1 Tax=Wasmannia auropunctata TaxID=64793 RepID=UPI0005EEEA20
FLSFFIVIDTIIYSNFIKLLGWGLTEYAGRESKTLQKVDLNIISLQECSNTYPAVTNGNICTYTPKKDTCQRDSGGPLLWQNPNTKRLVLAGIIVGGTGCASDEPAINTRTGAYIDWILSVTSDARYCDIE